MACGAESDDSPRGSGPKQEPSDQHGRRGVRSRKATEQRPARVGK
jgi:hypothetical protein